jgi:hypothetical protein
MRAFAVMMVSAGTLGGCAAPGASWSDLSIRTPCCASVAHLPFAAVQADVLAEVSVDATAVFLFAEELSTFAAFTLPAPSVNHRLRLRIDSFVRPSAQDQASAFMPVALWLDSDRMPLAAPQPVGYRQAFDLWRGEHLTAVLPVPPMARHVVLYTTGRGREDRFVLRSTPWMSSVPLGQGATVLMPTPGRTRDVSSSPVGRLRVLVEPAVGAKADNLSRDRRTLPLHAGGSPTG